MAEDYGAPVFVRQPPDFLMDDGLKVRAGGGGGRQAVEIDSRLDALPPPGGAAAESGGHAVGDAVEPAAE